MRLRQFNEKTLVVSDFCINFASQLKRKDMRMNCLIERQMYRDINDFVEQISYFAARDIKESTKNDGYITFDDDMLDLIETFCNCKHVHQEILKEIETETERELFNRGIYGKPVKIKGTTIIFQK